MTSDPTERADWLYFQIFLPPPGPNPAKGLEVARACCDRLLDRVRLWVEHARREDWLRRYFFLRYLPGGYHLRFRLCPCRDELQEPVRAHLLSEIARFYADVTLDLELVDLPLGPEGLERAGLVRMPVYAPELEKYGGRLGMDLAEKHFEVSSDLCLEVLRSERESGVNRSHFALELAAILMHCLGESPAERALVLRSYVDYWIAESGVEAAALRGMLDRSFGQQSARLAARLGGDASLERTWERRSGLFSVWREHLQDHVPALIELERNGLLRSPASLEAAPDLPSDLSLREHPLVSLLILPNYLHLLNNRLGLTILQEVQLAHLLCRWIEETEGVRSLSVPLRLEPRQV